MKAKRLWIATALGLIFGFVCYLMASSGGALPVGLAISIILGRTLIGFAIGISRFSMRHWSIHGIAMGFLFSLPAGFGAMAGAEGTDFNPEMMLASTIALGAVYGFLTEFATTVLFKAKQ